VPRVKPEIARTDSQRYYTPVLGVLLLACIVRFWLFLLPESFWLDETVTAFIVRHGANDPSLAASPHLDQTIYYWLPRLSQAIFGFSEFSLRLPSLAVTLISLYLIARLAARFVHPQATWVAVFLCFIPHEFTRQATDARPYGLGTCVALCAIFFLTRGLDRNVWRDFWRDAAPFVLFAALLLRIHLIYWPFYAIFPLYAGIRSMRKETPVSRRALAAVFAIVAVSLLPLIPVTMSLFGSAKIHVVTEMPTLKTILGGFQIPLIAAVGIGFWLLGKAFRWPRPALTITTSRTALLLAWWLWQPACLLAFSWITGNSVFLPRYFSLAIPGMILACTLAASYSIPPTAWKPAASILAIGILIFGSWKQPFPPSRNSHWREAAQAVNDLTRNTGMPIVCPSPFIEAQPPVWTPAYTLPGFLYAHLDAYPVSGATNEKKILLPARLSPEGEQYATQAISDRLAPAGHFVVYGGVYSVNLWQSWLAGQPRLNGWTTRQSGSFGDVSVVLFEQKFPDPTSRVSSK
jgi:hypothetical protein